MIIITGGSIVAGFLLWVILSSIIEVFTDSMGEWLDKQMESDENK